jgi:predicted ArsR family transcriptional regulator
MTEARWDRRFFASTRGRIVRLLRRSESTVDDLAASLDLTDNAVRSHLATLERDGLVEQHGLRRGERRPAHVYGLTPNAERLFPRGYEPVLDALLTIFGERLPAEQLEAALREVGRRLAVEFDGSAATDPRARILSAVAVLEALGGLLEVEDEGGIIRLRGYGCPLAGVTTNHPMACRLAEALVQEIVGAPVRECCDRTEHPRCQFEVDLTAARLPSTPR